MKKKKYYYVANVICSDNVTLANQIIASDQPLPNKRLSERGDIVHYYRISKTVYSIFEGILKRLPQRGLFGTTVLYSKL